ncbi:MAG: prepilin-type N-terminal cleavage/methylation domain-containing protein, partial [Verrucomicrobiota bacterium]
MRRTLYNHTRGFTLLEVILGLGIASLVIGGIFAIAGGALDLSARTQRLRLEETRHTKLDQLFRQTFANLKPESQLVVSGGQHLIISKPGAGLTWPGSTPSAEILATYLRPVYTTTCRAARSIWRGSDVVNRSCSFLLLPAEMIRNHLELPKKVEQAT